MTLTPEQADEWFKSGRILLISHDGNDEKLFSIQKISVTEYAYVHVSSGDGDVLEISQSTLKSKLFLMSGTSWTGSKTKTLAMGPILAGVTSTR